MPDPTGELIRRLKQGNVNRQRPLVRHARLG